MRNQKNHTPPHIKINCWMYHFFNPSYLSFMLPHIARSP